MPGWGRSCLAVACLVAPASVGAAYGGATDRPIVFAATASTDPRSTSIWTVRPDGTQRVELTHPAKGSSDQYPAWSHSHDEIAFLRAVPTGNVDFHGDPTFRTDLWVVRPDGRDGRLLTRNAFGAGDWYGVAWAPNDKRVAFTRGAWIWTIDVSGGGLHKVARGDCASWSPDGSEIAFKNWQGSEGRNDYFVVSAGGGTPRPLAPGFTDNTYWCPAWSPDGRRIAFLGSASDASPVSLWIADRDGSNLRKLAQHLDGKDTNRAHWSPDGSRLLVESLAGATVDLPSSGGPMRRIARGTYYPTWSPDGRLVAFVGSQFVNSTRASLYVVTRTGGVPRVIARGAQTSFDW